MAASVKSLPAGVLTSVFGLIAGQPIETLKREWRIGGDNWVLSRDEENSHIWHVIVVTGDSARTTAEAQIADYHRQKDALHAQLSRTPDTYPKDALKRAALKLKFKQIQHEKAYLEDCINKLTEFVSNSGTMTVFSFNPKDFDGKEFNIEAVDATSHDAELPDIKEYEQPILSIEEELQADGQDKATKKPKKS